MSGAVIFVMTLASAITWGMEQYILIPFRIEYMRIIVFILVIAAFVQTLDIVMKKTLPRLHATLGIFLPLITTNCAVLGVAILNVQLRYNFVEATLFGFAAALGFALALLIFAGLREKIDRADPPRSFKGVAIALITAGLLSLAFMGFSGLVK